MNDFLGILNLITIQTADAGLLLHSMARMTGGRERAWHYLLFLPLSFLVLYVSTAYQSRFAGLVLNCLLLCLAGSVLYRAKWSTSALSVILITEIMRLCYGTVYSLTAALSPAFHYLPLKPVATGFLLMVIGEGGALGLGFVCCRSVWRSKALKNKEQNRYVFMILIPLIMILIAGEYIVNIVYGNTVTIDERGFVLGANHILLLFFQSLCLASLFSILHAYKKMSQVFGLNTRLALLEQESESLRRYVEEARVRYEETRAFRHDIKNHLTVMEGLMEKEDRGPAREYLSQMGRAAAELSFPWNTGRPAVDILLESKGGIARAVEIELQCSVTLPPPEAVSDMDLCIILSNALDNAIHACKQVSDPSLKYIRLTGRLQGDFFLLEAENGCGDWEEHRNRKGLGLSNIRTVAEKYQGAVNIERSESRFLLTVLLILSQQD